jgi:arylsulfatase
MESGYDSGDAVSSEYKMPGTFKGGTIWYLGITVEKAYYADLEQDAKRVMMRN